LIFGIIAGLLAGLCQSISFVFSRLTAIRYQGRALTILCMAHLIMGVFSICILPFLTFEKPPEVLSHLNIIFPMAGFYLAGMAFFFLAIKNIDASRATPILGMKVVFVAILLVIFQGANYGLLQWIAIGLTSASVFFLNISGTTIPWKSTALVLLTAILYASSDLFIKKVIVAYSILGGINSLLFPCIINFILCGVISAILLIFLKGKSFNVWKGSLWFAIAYFSANFLSFYAISKIDIVYSNIAMSTRGIFSILLGASLAYIGIHDLETKVSKKVVIGRCIAGVMLTASIALFSL
jgi:drug/metabolite transporter (DMT)-like permease